jgi:hypothetical protein
VWQWPFFGGGCFGCFGLIAIFPSQLVVVFSELLVDIIQLLLQLFGIEVILLGVLRPQLGAVAS